MAYNNTFRMFFNLDRLCSVSGEMNQRSIGTCNEIQHKLMCSLYRRIFQSGNNQEHLTTYFRKSVHLHWKRPISFEHQIAEHV